MNNVIFPFPKETKGGDITYRRLLSLSERASRLKLEAEDLQQDILTWIQINAKEREAQ